MLNERERHALARIEQHLADTDPELVQLFERKVPCPATSGSIARILLIIGMVLLLLGSVASLVPVALFGGAVAMIALWMAYVTPTAGTRRPRIN